MTISGEGEQALRLDAAAAIANAPLDHPVRVRFELGRAMIEETLARFGGRAPTPPAARHRHR